MQFIYALTALVCLFLSAPAYAGPAFLDVNECASEECGEQRKGYAWAKQNNISDYEGCEDHDGGSEPFIEGCEAFVDENRAPEDE